MEKEWAKIIGLEMNSTKLAVHILAVVLVLATASAQPPNIGPKGGRTRSGTRTPSSVSVNDNNFCTRVSMKTEFCPNPPTINSMDMKNLMGTYYQIGSTASFKLRNEMGVACTRTNFSFPTQPPSPSAGVILNVENSGIPVLQPRSSTTSALSRIAASTSAICRSAARICSAGPLSASLVRLSAITNDLPSQHRILSHASSIIQSAISDVDQHIDSLVLSTAEIARTISTISQSGSSTSALDPLLGSLRSTAFGAVTQLRALAGSTVANLTSARNSIAQVADGLSDANAVSLLMDAANSLHVEIGAMITEFSKVEEMLRSIGGPLSDNIAADTTGTNTAPFISGSDIISRMIISSGQAVEENAGDAGNFTFQFTEMFNESSDSTGSDSLGDPIIIDDSRVMPYKIIGIDGAAGMEYQSLLVYSCVPDPDGGPLPLSDLVLLSRNPTLPLRSIVRLLDIANRYGISRDCFSTFVPTLQTISDSNGRQYSCST